MATPLRPAPVPRAAVPGAAAARKPIDPYRVLFPLGVLYGIVGALLWPLHAAGLIPYPAVTHWTLMIQGFQHAFILGFLLTSMPAWMHSLPSRPWELATATVLMLGVGVAALLGSIFAVQLFYTATLVLVVVMALRRVSKSTSPPPEEFLLVAFGLLLGFAGAVMAGGAALGAWAEPSPRFGLRLIWMGMILSIVLGVGGLLVPTFTSMRDPLVIPGIAKPHVRKPRRILYALIALAMLGSLLLEASGRLQAGALVRAATGSLVLLLVWKLFRLPGRHDRVSYFLWGSGWMIFAGLWLMALAPQLPLLGAHTLFIGGFGALSAGIATRVVIRHGSYPIVQEGFVLRPAMALLLATAVVTRLLAELLPSARMAMLSVSGSGWILAWLVWIAGALPRVLRRAPAEKVAFQPSPRPTQPTPF
ncbi:MAG TPA: NnrS family protein [Candidatus Eisenbacteria bacterium]|nr:NnrS family protein [Candidatus Eisenbacteria bacterium]